MTKIIEIHAFPKNNDSQFIFNRFEGNFVNSGDANTVYETREAAEADLEIARAAWNEFDAVEVVEYEVEE